jgi:hypothetical protein
VRETTLKRSECAKSVKNTQKRHSGCRAAGNRDHLRQFDRFKAVSTTDRRQSKCLEAVSTTDRRQSECLEVVSLTDRRQSECLKRMAMTDRRQSECLRRMAMTVPKQSECLEVAWSTDWRDSRAFFGDRVDAFSGNWFLGATDSEGNRRDSYHGRNRT